MTVVPGGFDPADDPYREWDAAYVLGALAPGERREYERHLAACDACREAVAEIAGIPGVLGTVTPQERAGLLAPAGEGAEPDDGGGGPVVVPLAGVAAAARRSRARRRSLLVAAAAALVAGGVTGGVALAGGFGAGVPLASSVQASAEAPSEGQAQPGGPAPTAESRTIVLEPVGGTDVHAELTATATAWGTRLDWRCRYPRPPAASTYGTAGPSGAAGDGDRTYELVIVDGTGARTVVASWTAEGLEAEGLGASSAVPLDDVQRVEIAVGGRPEPLASATL
ncbi:zf-HC2 domain-containing protein [Puerhibacterium puerhi]|uniref:zf-HC2 domain-containing protein n=1 Tax=Puerhibacterium puerhi TaxID=2692623 RepID=UPI00135AC0B2|nr:zf-HC2 domain-containing protein [Puerhibacterium puerhi]